ncbi:hypothetical protein [Tellurirhabdus bombi]|uniref:hypothetical protein n=1 Tax=Tellurirhabdus bombi TaxID=2907205 RepID=UPI001F420079|nr:hypothetical protein [Tellurirhabdus bombi]
MTNPFTTLVGLKDVTTAVSYVNDLPGLSTELVEALETSDAPDAKAVWDRTHRAALDRTISEIEGLLAKEANYNSVLAQMEQPQPLDGVSEPALCFNGVTIEVPASPNSRLRLMNLTFMANIESSVNAELVIIDLKRKPHRELQRMTHLVLPGVNTLPIGIDHNIALLESPRLFIGIKSTSLSLVKLSEPTWSVCNDSYKVAKAQYVESVAACITNENLPACYVYLEAEHQRTLAAVLPRFAQQLRFAYLNLCGSLLMTEKLGSPNFNLFTNTNREFTIEQEAALEKQFKSSLKPVVRLIRDHLMQVGNLKPNADDQAGYYSGSFV